MLTEQQSNAVFQGGRQLPWNSTYVDPRRDLLRGPGAADLAPPPRRRLPGADARDRRRRHAARARRQGRGNRGAGRGRRGVRAEARGGGRRDDDAGGRHHGRGRRRAKPPATDPAAAKVAAELRRATITNLLSAIVAAAQARPADDSTFARLVFDAMVHGGYHDAVADAVKRRGLEREKGFAPEAVLTAHASELDGSALRALVLELAVGRGAYFAWSSSATPTGSPPRRPRTGSTSAPSRRRPPTSWRSAAPSAARASRRSPRGEATRRPAGSPEKPAASPCGDGRTAPGGSGPWGFPCTKRSPLASRHRAARRGGAARCRLVTPNREAA